MKTLLVLLIGAILGIAGYQYYLRNERPTVSQRAGDIADSTRHKAVDVKDTVVEKSKEVGEKMDDARIIGLIKGKYLLDKDLSVLAISVSCTDGQVILAGTAETAGLVARAVQLARDTSGVTRITSQLKVRN